MKRMIRSIGAIGLIVGALAACGSGTDTGAPTPTPTTPQTEEFDEKSWRLETPEGWTRKVVTKTADAKLAIRYEGPDGEYFIVAIDPLGSDFAYDALWEYEVDGSGFKVVSRTECDGETDSYCRDTDARYDGYLMWETGTTPEKVGGHVWYFIFGDADSTTIDADVFTDIVASIEVK